MASIDRAGIFAIVRDQLSEILEIDPGAISEGQSFVDDLDAALDRERTGQTLLMRTADVAEGIVLRVARSGWLLHDRVLRPAAVFVSAGAAK